MAVIGKTDVYFLAIVDKTCARILATDLVGAPIASLYRKSNLYQNVLQELRMRVPFFMFIAASLFLAACGRNCQQQLEQANYSNNGQVDQACYSATNYNTYRNNGGNGYSNYGGGYSNTGYNTGDQYYQGY